VHNIILWSLILNDIKIKRFKVKRIKRDTMMTIEDNTIDDKKQMFATTIKQGNKWILQWNCWNHRTWAKNWPVKYD